jgi:hypothetical protein
MQMNDGRRRSSAWKQRRAGAGHYFSHAGGETQRAAPAGTVVVEGDYFDACGGFEDVALGTGYDYDDRAVSEACALGDYEIS